MPFLLVALLAWGIWLWSGDAEQAAQVNYSAQRNEAQDSILVGLTALNDPAVNAFVNEWRRAYPSPTPEQLSRLRIAATSIHNDPRVAQTYTVSWKNTHALCGQLTSPFGDIECEPGI
ncbi:MULTISPECIES: hypothetical protein [Pseudomonas]|uniref:Uncharacterized protein n=1 Tax=Pseudomonas luteola TaxID=47886 RepID=A0ABS0MXJ8_PSELU|nr:MULTISPECIES: hypothetical protein [Pseudomonas]MBA1250280.1 hypothetical protein [Pseudomonas zeshuii]MBH3441433.1 hypothetical protein [Pseudomonas luteola]QEU26710.1 hypothetical protein FOB45_02580 [Pseudomonas luteola]RRW39961.1 hypothetical protein EGJ50_25200 [Pseudomonas luteola]